MRLHALLPLAALLCACRPDLGDPESLVKETRILGVRGEPAESKPNQMVSYRALVVTPGGTSQDPALDWAFCATPKPLIENDIVAAACLGDGVRALPGPAATLDATTPMDACQLFGPDPPPGNLRPRDPDQTGGFYQPLRVSLGGIVAFDLERVLCDLPNAPIAVAFDFQKRYRPNENPTLAPLTTSVEGRRVTLTTGWGEGDAETYVMFDQASGAIVQRREAMRVSWFVTAGTLQDEVTGRGEDDMATTTSNTWTAPESGTAHLWIVLRDSRGGSDFASYELAVP